MPKLANALMVIGFPLLLVGVWGLFQPGNIGFMFSVSSFMASSLSLIIRLYERVGKLEAQIRTTK